MLRENLSSHFSTDFEGWALHVKDSDVYYLAHVSFNRTGSFCILVDCVVTLIPQKLNPETILVEAMYVDEFHEQHFLKSETINLAKNEFSLSLLTLLKNLEKRNFLVENKSHDFEKKAISCESDAISKRVHSHHDVIETKFSILEHKSKIFKEKNLVIKQEPLSRKEQDSPARKRISRFSKEYLAEALNDSGSEKEDKSVVYKNKRLKKIRKLKEDDKPFTIPGKKILYNELSCNDTFIGPCRLCRLELTVKDAVDHHRLHHEDQVSEHYKCPICGKTAMAMSYHVRKFHASKLEKCDLCNKSFVTKTGIEKHRKRVHFPENLEFKCEICLKKYVTKKHLEIHVKLVHKRVRDYMCYICGAGYVTPSKLKRHFINVHHLFEKQHECSFCGKKFAEEEGLRRHLMTHSDICEYECSTCGKTFKTPGNLKQHKVCHDPPKHVCLYCGKKFLYSQGMRFHVKHVHKDVIITDPGKKKL